MVELYLARHGETEENVAKILQGHLPGHLTETGKLQARQLRETLVAEGIRFDVLLVSDLKRTLDTAAIVNASLGLPLVPCPLLRERDWGTETGARIGQARLDPLPEGAESIDALFERARNFLQYLLENYDGQRVLAISHGLFSRCIQAALRQVTIRDITPMQNAEVRRLTVSPENLQPAAKEKGEDLVSAN